MRVLVIYTSKPVDVIHVPSDASPSQLEEQTARLDAAGVNYAVLNFIPNEEAADLAEDVDRFVQDAALAASHE